MVKEKIKFYNGNEVPALGLGTWKMRENVNEIVRNAIKIGYRHIDCAPAYFNQKEVGKAIQDALQDNHLRREDIFVTSKLWCTHHGSQNVKPAVEQTLKELQLDYLDLFLIHWPISFTFLGLELKSEKDLVKLGDKLNYGYIPLYETWEAMEKLVEDGLVKNIGVSNYSVPLLHDCLSYSKIKPVTNQVEFHPYLVQNNLVKYCQSENVVLSAYSPLASGASENPRNDETIQEIAKKYNKSATQVTLRWNLQKGNVVIVKASSYDHLKENFEIFDFNLTQEDISKIDGLNKDMRVCDFSSMGWGINMF